MSAVYLPFVCSGTTTFSPSFCFYTSTFGAPTLLRVFDDLQCDFQVPPNYLTQDYPLSPDSAALLAAGMSDVSEGRVSPVPPDFLEST